MAWCGIQGHDAVLEQFRRGLQRHRLASSFLFVGPSGIGKRLFAHRLAQGLLCDTRPAERLEPCLSCTACQLIDSGTHPDVEVVARPPGKSFIPVDLFIGDREHRSQEGLCHRLSLRPASGKRRIAIIEDADFLNEEGANCLLKTLEEPPPGSVLILIGTSQQRQLPTIRSRCQVIRFRRLSDEMVRDYLQTSGLSGRDGQLASLLALADGSLELASQYASEELASFRDELFARLAQRDLESQSLAKWIVEFMEGAGADLATRRDRLRHVIRLCLLFLRQRLLQSTTRGPDGSREPPAASAAPLDGLDSDAGDDVARIQRCLDAMWQVDANANLATLIECWIDDLFFPTGSVR